MTRYDDLMAELRDAARPDREPPAAFAAYLDTVRRYAYRTTDADVQQLKDDGFSEDQIFEQTVSTAAAAGFDRLDSALRTLR